MRLVFVCSCQFETCSCSFLVVHMCVLLHGSSSNHLPIISQSSSIHLPIIFRSSSNHLPLIFQSSSDHLPIISPGIPKSSSNHIPHVSIVRSSAWIRRRNEMKAERLIDLIISQRYSVRLVIPCGINGKCCWSRRSSSSKFSNSNKTNS